MRLGMTGCFLCALFSGVAGANPAEVFGLGSKSAARVGAVAADSDDFAAAYYNPAGLGFATGKRLTVGMLGAAPHLEINGRSQELAEPVGGYLGVTLPVPLGGSMAGKLVFGLAFYSPTVIARIVARLPDEPFFPYYDNRSQRLIVMPALAWRATPELAFGVGLDVLAGVGGAVLAVEGPTRSIEPRVDEEIATRVALHLGARWQPLPEHRFALAYRQAFGVRFSTLAEVDVAGEPLALDLAAEGLYTPHQLVLGYAYRPDDDLVLSADVTLSLWSAYGGPYVTVTSALPLVGPLPGRTPDVPWKNTAALRAGVERRLGSVFLRGGYGYELSPVPRDQGGITNLIDGPKHLLGFGVGVAFGRVRIDAHVQAHIVGASTLEKTIAGAEDEESTVYDALRDEIVDDASEPDTLGVQISNPGYPEISGSGEVFSGGVTVEWQL